MHPNPSTGPDHLSNSTNTTTTTTTTTTNTIGKPQGRPGGPGGLPPHSPPEHEMQVLAVFAFRSNVRLTFLVFVYTILPELLKYIQKQHN